MARLSFVLEEIYFIYLFLLQLLFTILFVLLVLKMLPHFAHLIYSTSLFKMSCDAHFIAPKYKMTYMYSLFLFRKIRHIF